MKRCVIAFLVISLFLSSISFGESNNIFVIKEESTSLGLKQVSLLPEDYSGFCMAICADQVNLNSIKADHISDDGRICYFNLTDKECKELLFDATPVSIGPNGAILWATSGEKTLIVQHEKTLVILLQALNRGVKDSSGLFADNLRYKYMTSPKLVMGEVRWSPDGRYIFLNENEKWFGTQFDIEDPYLIDTITGELFLVESDGIKKSITQDNFQFVAGGRFSLDSSYFYYYMRARDRHIIKQYNLNTGSIVDIYESSCDRFHDFCEIGSGDLIIIEQDSDEYYIVRKAKSNKAKKEKITAPAGANISIFPLYDDNALLKADFGSRLSSIMFVQWNRPLIDDDWYVISNNLDGSLKKKTTLEIENISGELYIDLQKNTSPNKAYISKVIALPEEDKYVISATVNRIVPNSWDGMIQRLNGIFLLDKNNKSVVPITLGNENYTLGNDSIAYAPAFLMDEDNHMAYWFISKSETENPYIVVQTDDSLLLNKEYSCSTGCYLYDSKGLSPVGIKTRNTELSSNIILGKDNILIETVFSKEIDDTHIYMIPYAISKERYTAFTGKLSKATKKKLSSFFHLYEPSKLKTINNADVIISCYPNVVEKPLYVLKADIDDKALSKIEQYFIEAGYTEEDYTIDLQEVNLSKMDNTITKPIYYSFSSIIDGWYTSTEMLQLSGLCDMINSRIYIDHLKSGYYRKNNTNGIENQVVVGILQKRDSEELNIASIRQLIREYYSIDGVNYTVTIDNIEETDESLTIKLSITR